MNVKDGVLVAAGTFLVVIGAYLSLPIGPIPVIMTNFFIILVCLLLGFKRSAVVILTYIILGAVGLPVFSGGKAGLAHILGLTGGFLIGFIPLALLSGLASGKSLMKQVILVISGSIVLYLIGVPWAYYISNNVAGYNWDIPTTLKYTTIPFLLPDLGKVIAAIAISKLITPVVDPFLNGSDE